MGRRLHPWERAPSPRAVPHARPCARSGAGGKSPSSITERLTSRLVQTSLSRYAIKPAASSAPPSIAVAPLVFGVASFLGPPSRPLCVSWGPLVDNNVCILPSSTSTTRRALDARVPSHYIGAELALGSDSRRGTSRVGESIGQAPTPRERAPHRVPCPTHGHASDRGRVGRARAETHQ